MSFPSITNRSEYFSEHYLEALVQGDLKDLRAQWDVSESHDAATPRKAIKGLGTPFFRHKADAAGDADALHGLHDAVLAALGFPRADEVVEGTHGDAIAVELRVAHAVQTDTGLALLVLEGPWAADVDDALSEEGALPAPPTVDGQPLADPAKAISAAFALDDAPAHVLLLAGAVVVLATREKWGEGRFLAVDLDLALGRMDVTSKGELETIAALFSRDALIASGPEADALIDRLGASSHKQAVAVSKDLREGVRLSVEDLANEIVARTLEKKLAVYGEPDIENRLTRESLRFLYRILFLLYAEARPELAILPTTAQGYQEGYGLDRLRELVLVDLTTDQARAGSHLHDSLNLLFGLVDQGYHHEHAEQQFVPFEDEPADDTGLIFEPLRSDLFGSQATGLIDRIRIRNEVLQRILRRLLLTRQRGGQARQFVSYATLGINQLGAVYEGLTAYTGFLAKEDLNELHLPGSDEDGGTWVVSAANAGQYPEEAFVERTDEDGGHATRVRHPKGSFVYRLSGRDRQRSASYYTPEALTRCVVQHALAELLDQDGARTSADHILELRVCEPALGSGAFLNEAVRQLAAEYLRRKEAELGEAIDPDAYGAELQKVKAHLALHQCYGVDLNPTAIELAEVSLWLGAMHRGLQAPWFGLHLRRGNSLIGARRATYKTAQLVNGAWTKAAPVDSPLATRGIGSDEIHHFLVPALGWGAVGDAKQAKELEPLAAGRLRTWRQQVCSKVATADAKRFAALAKRVEVLWGPAIARLELAERDLRRELGVWGQPPVLSGGVPTTHEAVRQAIRNENSALVRLRLVMDAWCALWFWPLNPPADRTAPSREGWLSAMEDLLGIDPGDFEWDGQLDLGMTLGDLEAVEERLTAGLEMKPVSAVVEAHPWLEVVADLANRQGFFHWELEFGHVFKRGGFDLQVGNPPWVRPRWLDDLVLAEIDPWFGLAGGAHVNFDARRDVTLADPEHRDAYIAELTSATAITQFLSAPVLEPDLVGLQLNLYMRFMTETWRHMAPEGTVGLLHPEGHFVEPKGGRLRRAAYPRQRRHWHFVNEARLFEDVHHMTDFGVHVYGASKLVDFRMINNVHVPETVEGSLLHDGHGAVPGIKTASGEWDRRPHRDRLLEVDQAVLEDWVLLFDEPNTAWQEARLLRPHTRQDAEVLDGLAAAEQRLEDRRYRWTRGWEEDKAKKDGTLAKRTAVPSTWDEVILQGPHFVLCNPFAKQPNEGCKNNLDWSTWDLETLSERMIPRTNYQRACSRELYDAGVAHWDGQPSTAAFRAIYRRMAGIGGVRSLQSALVPPGPMHVNTCHTVKLEEDRDTALLVGLWSSLPLDFLFKASGRGDVQDDLARRFPSPSDTPFDTLLLLRTLRLNCLTREYEPLWHELFEPDFTEDTFSSEDPRLPELGAVTRDWSMDTPLRRDFHRRQALVEIDALGALMLGLSADQLCAIYRTQFAVLRKYEHYMRFDREGRQVPNDVVRAYEEDPRSADIGRYMTPFTKPDREADMRRAYAAFEARVGAAVR